MIDTKAKLNEYLKVEEGLYRAIGYKGKFHSIITQCEVGKIFLFIKVLRKDEFYSNTSGGMIRKIASLYYRRRHNIIGQQLGISIPINTFEKGLLIYHSQGIIVHKDVRCGEYCKLHGLNCIGNNGNEKAGNNVPVIGSNVNIGVGASVIGAVFIASNTIIAAHALVCKSCLDEGGVLIGIPATNKMQN